MPNSNFSQKTIAALVMGLGVSCYVSGAVSNLQIVSTSNNSFTGEFFVDDEKIPDSASVGIADRSKYGLPEYSDDVSKIILSKAGNRVVVEGPMPKDKPLFFAVEISAPERVLVKQFNVNPVNNTGVSETKTASDSPVGVKPSEVFNSQSLSLGELKTISVLGQKLSLEVEISGSALSGKNKVDVQVVPDVNVLGDNQQLSQDLSNLEYKVVKKPSGQRVLRLRSKKPVHDPILPIQIEAMVGNERSVKQFTVLLDPAGYQQQGYENLKTSENLLVLSDKRVKKAESTVQPPIKKPKTGNNGLGGALKVYKVLKGDSLFEIAKKMQGNQAISEKMQFLKSENPNAFIRGDINLLRAGSILHYPSNWSVAVRSDILADASVPRNSKVTPNIPNSINSPRGSKPKAANGAKNSQPVVKSAVRGEIVSQKPNNVKETPPIVDGSKAVESPKVTSSNTVSKVTTAPSKKTEAITPAVKADVNTVNTAVLSKNLEQTADNATLPEAKTSNPNIEAVEGRDKSVSPPLENVAGDPSGADLIQKEKALNEKLAAQDEELALSMREASVLKSEIASLSQKMSQSGEGQGSQAPAGTSSEEGGLFVLVDDYKEVVGVVGLLALAVLGGVWLRARKKRRLNAYESLEGISGDVSGLALTSLMSSSDPSGADLDLTDPLDDAELSVQGGDVTKALDLLREGLTREPMRQDVRLRLLELLAHKNEQHAFVEEALVAKTLFGENSPLWQRVSELAQILNPIPEKFVKKVQHYEGTDSQSVVRA